MDVREKLVELLKSVLPNFRNNMAYWGEKPIYEFADCLLANSVTVQEWILVKDRLPKHDEIVIICTDENFIYAGELVGDTWFLDNDSWTATVTHWMPLPLPPKGE